MAKISWKIWEQFAPTFKHAESWFNFLSNVYPVCERLASCSFFQIYTLSISLIPAQVAKVWGRARDVQELSAFCLDCSVRIHRIAFETHPVVAGIEDFLQQWRKRIWWTEVERFSPCCYNCFGYLFFPCLVPSEPPSSVLVTPHTTSSVLVQWQVGKMKNFDVSGTMFLLLCLVDPNDTLQGTFSWAGSTVVKLKDCSYSLIFLILASILVMDGNCWQLLWLCAPRGKAWEVKEFL